MPLISWAHSAYWDGDGEAPPPPVVSAGGYPAWQAAVNRTARVLVWLLGWHGTT